MQGDESAVECFSCDSPQQECQSPTFEDFLNSASSEDPQTFISSSQPSFQTPLRCQASQRTSKRKQQAEDLLNDIIAANIKEEHTARRKRFEMELQVLKTERKARMAEQEAKMAEQKMKRTIYEKQLALVQKQLKEKNN